MNGTSALVKDAQEIFLTPLHHMRLDLYSDDHLGTRSLPDTKSAGTLILDLPSSSLTRHKFLLLMSHKIYSILL
jgi:hypothetical protein